MSAATIIYYSVKSTTGIAKLAIDYRKIQEISKLRTELERQKSISESIQSYTRLIKSDVQALMHMYFKSAIENLNYALTASGKNQKEYLRQARNRFIDATTIEKNENLILSYIGLALCQALTNDNENSTKTISKIRDVHISLPDDIKELASMMMYYNESAHFIYKYIGRRAIFRYLDFKPNESEEESFDYAFNEAMWFIRRFCSSKEREFDFKQHFKRLLNAVIACGGFSMNSTRTEIDENFKRAIKKILQEDFEAFKSETLLKFEIN